MTYHQCRLRCMLSRLLIERRDGGEFSTAFLITSGSCTPGGNVRPRPEKIRVVRVPERNVLPCTLGGLGVVGREGMGVTEREEIPLSLESLPSAMRRSCQRHGEERLVLAFTHFWTRPRSCRTCWPALVCAIEAMMYEAKERETEEWVNRSTVDV
jgi:hypothetical protein